MASAASVAPVGPACPACDARAAGSVAWPSGLSFHRCERCALLFTHPTPSPAELEAFYQGFLYRRPPRAKIPRLIAERQRELCHLFGLSRDERVNAGRRFLDHGGGTGVAYAAAQRLGLESWFAEMDRQAITFVTEEFGLPASHLVQDLGQHEARFDCVLSDNVIEHVPDPAGLIRELWRSLVPGGELVIKTPHAASTDMYFYPRVWFKYMRKVATLNGWRKALNMVLDEPVWCCDPPRHLYSFTRESLTLLAQHAGVQPGCYRIETYDTPLLKNSFTEQAFSRARGLRGRLRRAALLPILPAEWLGKLVQYGSRSAGWLSPGGLILRVRRDLPLAAPGLS